MKLSTKLKTIYIKIDDFREEKIEDYIAKGLAALDRSESLDKLETKLIILGITTATVRDGTGSIIDVQQNGTSVVTDGVANVIVPDAQVQADWNETSILSKAYILNKPTIPIVPTALSSFTDDLGSNPVHTHSQYLQSISNTDVINALGYTPYSDANPNGYIKRSDRLCYIDSAMATSGGKINGEFWSSCWIKIYGLGSYICIQSEEVTRSEATQTVTFPIAYTGKYLPQVFIQAHHTSASADGRPPLVNNITLTGFTLNSYTKYNHFSWIAIGSMT